MKRIDLIAVALAVFAAASMVLATAHWGPAVYQLGLHNITAAQALLDGREMCTTRGEAFTQWPPLFAWVLALGKWLGIDYADTACATNAAAYAVVILANWALLVRLFASRVAAFASSLALIASTPFFTQMTLLGSEPIFIALIMVTAWFAVLDLERPRRATFAGLVICGGLLCLQRYVGVAFVGALALLVWRQSPRKASLRRAAAFTALAFVPLVLWMLRNKLLTGLATGDRTEPESSFRENIASTSSTLVRWWLASDTNALLTRGVAVLVALMLAATLLRPRLAAEPSSERRALIAYSICPVVYLVFIVACANVIALDMLDERLLLPIFPFAWGLVALGAVTLVRHASRMGRLASVSVAIGLALAFVFVIGDNAKATRIVIEHCRANGPGGFSARSYIESETVRWLQTHPWPGVLYSNFPELTAFATCRPTKLVPRADARKFLASTPTSDSPFLLVWVEGHGDPIANALTHAGKLDFQVESIAKLNGANIYRIEVESEH